MKRIVRNVAAFVVGLLLSSMFVLAHAETMPATYGAAPAGWYWKVSYISPSPKYSTCEAAAMASASPPDYPSAHCGTCSGTRPSVSCQRYAVHTSGSFSYYGSVAEICDGTWNGTNCVQNTSTWYCPSTGGWTLSGTNCVRPDCAPGETRQPDGTCKTQCPGAGASNSTTGTFVEGSGGIPGELCVGGCTYSSNFCLGVGSGFGCQVGASTGKSCSMNAIGSNGTPTQNQPSQTAINNQNAINCIQQGQQYGTVNGVTVCSGPSSTTTSSSTKTTTQTDPSNNTTTSTTTSNTSCSGDNCTTTTTNTSGGGTTTTTTTQPKGDFCKDNPQNVACKSQNEQDDYCKTHPDSLQCMSAGTPSDGAGEIGTKAVGVSSITAVTLATNMGCPAPQALPHGWGVLDPKPICDLADLLRPLVLAFAWLSAGLIVIGGMRNDA